MNWQKTCCRTCLCSSNTVYHFQSLIPTFNTYRTDATYTWHSWQLRRTDATYTWHSWQLRRTDATYMWHAQPFRQDGCHIYVTRATLPPGRMPHICDTRNPSARTDATDMWHAKCRRYFSVFLKFTLFSPGLPSYSVSLSHFDFLSLKKITSTPKHRYTYVHYQHSFNSRWVCVRITNLPPSIKF